MADSSPCVLVCSQCAQGVNCTHRSRRPGVLASSQRGHGSLPSGEESMPVEGDDDGDSDGDGATVLSSFRSQHANLGAGERSGARISLHGRLTARRRWNGTLVIDVVVDGGEAVQVLVRDDAQSDGGATLAVRMITLGSRVCITDAEAGRTGRGIFCLHVLPDAVTLLQNYAGAQYLDPTSRPRPRFHLVPDTVRWQSALDKLGVGACNTLAWRGGEPLPVPPDPCLDAGGNEGNVHHPLRA